MLHPPPTEQRPLRDTEVMFRTPCLCCCIVEKRNLTVWERRAKLDV